MVRFSFTASGSTRASASRAWSGADGTLLLHGVGSSEMSSAPEDPSQTRPAAAPAEPAAAAGATSSAATNGADDQHRKGAALPVEAPREENDFWSVPDAPGFDPEQAEQHASKVFALWEIAPAITNAAIDSTQAAVSAGDEVWAAAGATATVEVPPGTVAASAAGAPERADAFAALSSASEAAAARGAAIVEGPPISVSSPGRTPAESTEELPRLPEARSTRHALLAVAALVGVGAVVGAFSLLSNPSPNASVSADIPTLAPPPATVSAAAPATAAPATSSRGEERPPVVGEVAPLPLPAAVASAAPGSPDRAEAARTSAAEPPSSAPPSAEPTARPQAAPAPQVGSAALPPPRVAPPPPMRRLQIRTMPPGATLLVDGTPVANPYRVELPLGSTHTVTATAEGYVTSTQTVTLARDRELVVQLERVRPPPLPPQAQASASARPPPPSSPAAAQARPERAPRVATTIRPRSGVSAHGAGFVTESPY
jgi:hypothetical protein